MFANSFQSGPQVEVFDSKGGIIVTQSIEKRMSFISNLLNSLTQMESKNNLINRLKAILYLSMDYLDYPFLVIKRYSFV